MINNNNNNSNNNNNMIVLNSYIRHTIFRSNNI